MQTFLPYADFALSAKVLDRARLGKQRIEVLTILRGGWANHPASKMWRGYEWWLAQYGIIICKEWISRGYQDTTLNKILEINESFPELPSDEPYWLGNNEFHLSHQSNLVRKFPEHYKKYFPDVPDNLPYIWPKENHENIL